MDCSKGSLKCRELNLWLNVPCAWQSSYYGGILPRHDFPFVCSVHYLSTCATCATLHDSSVKTRAKLGLPIDYAHTHGHRDADILVNLNFNFRDTYFRLSQTQRQCSGINCGAQ